MIGIVSLGRQSKVSLSWMVHDQTQVVKELMIDTSLLNDENGHIRIIEPTLTQSTTSLLHGPRSCMDDDDLRHRCVKYEKDMLTSSSSSCMYVEYQIN